MSKLMSLVTRSRDEVKPPIITIAGAAGRGKTTLASTFPDPILLRIEDGSASVPDMPALPKVNSVRELWDQLKMLLTEEHPFKTVVIDTVTKFDEYAEMHILEAFNHNKTEKDTAKAIGDIPYGTGYHQVGGVHRGLRNAATKLQEKGMGVVFISHTKDQTVHPPDGEKYNKLALDMNQKAATYYLNDVDMVAYMELGHLVLRRQGASQSSVNPKDMKVVDSGNRILLVTESASRDTKNRFGIKKDLEVPQGENPLIPYLYPHLNKEEQE